MFPLPANFGPQKLLVWVLPAPPLMRHCIQCRWTHAEDWHGWINCGMICIMYKAVKELFHHHHQPNGAPEWMTHVIITLGILQLQKIFSFTHIKIRIYSNKSLLEDASFVVGSLRFAEQSGIKPAVLTVKPQLILFVNVLFRVIRRF